MAVNIFTYIIIFIIGTLFGSFFTLSVYRLPIGQDIIHKHSYCPNCSHKLGVLDLIPIFSYIFLGGKCRYCGQKIRIRYLLLELLSGIVFVLFALSLNLDFNNLEQSKIIYFIFGILYIASLFIIAGIDKENISIQKKIMIFGIILEVVYMIYLYILEDFNIYRYVIYLSIMLILLIIDTANLKKKGNNNYTIWILILSLFMINFSYEYVYILTVIYSCLSIAIVTMVKKLKNKKKPYKKDEPKEIPIGFYMCICNIAVYILTTAYITYLI